MRLTLLLALAIFGTVNLLDAAVQKSDPVLPRGKLVTSAVYQAQDIKRGDDKAVEKSHGLGEIRGERLVQTCSSDSHEQCKVNDSAVNAAPISAVDKSK